MVDLGIITTVLALASLAAKLFTECRVFSSAPKKTSSDVSDKLTVVIDEFDGQVKSEIYEAAEIYLGNKLSSKNQKIKVSKSEKEKKIKVRKPEKEKNIKVNKPEKEKNIKVSKPEKEKNFKVSKPEKEKNIKVSKPEKEKNIKVSKPEKEKNIKVSKPEKEKNFKVNKPEKEKNIKVSKPEKEKNIKVSKPEKEKNFKVSKPEKEKNFKVTLKHNQKVKDVYRCHKVEWVWREYKRVDHRKGKNCGRISEMKSFELTFRKKHEGFVNDSYLSYIKEETKRLKR